MLKIKVFVGTRNKKYLNMFLKKYFSRHDIVEFPISLFKSFLVMVKEDECEKSGGLKLWFMSGPPKMIIY